MTGGTGESSTPPNPYEGLNPPRKNEFSVREILDLIDKRNKIAQETHTFKTDEDIRQQLQEQSDYQELVLRRAVQIAQGESSTIVVNLDQDHVLGVIFGISGTDIIQHKCYALITRASNDEAEPMEARIKWLNIKPETNNHLVISQGLAQKLGVTGGGRYQNNKSLYET